MRTALLVCLVCIVGTLLVPAALAQERVIAMEKGKTMLQGAGAYLFDDSSWMLQLQYSKFVTDQTALGISGMISHQDEWGTDGLLMVRVDQHLYNKDRPSRTVPYVAAMAARSFGLGSATGFGLAGGVKFFYRENSFVAPEFDVFRFSGETQKFLLITFGTLF
ncbi:MAG: hypothetical protein N2512_13740 [Armatimonadetes bacterium]|nr:hypothetical protein [Armatimonadota bacterium]